MPVVLRVDGFQVRVFLPNREHGPAHVHVTNGAGEVVVLLNTPEKAVSVRQVHGMKLHDVQRAVTLVAQHAAYLRQQWKKYHGE